VVEQIQQALAGLGFTQARFASITKERGNPARRKLATSAEAAAREGFSAYITQHGNWPSLELAQSLEAQGLEYLQFAFRWVNCLLLRELPAALAPRLLDAYAAEGDAFADFLLYALGAFALSWSADIQARDFQDLLMFLQAPPSAAWREPDLALMLTQAHLLRLQARAERDAAAAA
jgi:hypothetical protein